jgi:hypothetical protein
MHRWRRTLYQLILSIISININAASAEMVLVPIQRPYPISTPGYSKLQLVRQFAYNHRNPFNDKGELSEYYKHVLENKDISNAGNRSRHFALRTLNQLQRWNEFLNPQRNQDTQTNDYYLKSQALTETIQDENCRRRILAEILEGALDQLAYKRDAQEFLALELWRTGIAGSDSHQDTSLTPVSLYTSSFYCKNLPSKKALFPWYDNEVLEDILKQPNLEVKKTQFKQLLLSSMKSKESKMIFGLKYFDSDGDIKDDLSTFTLDFLLSEAVDKKNRMTAESCKNLSDMIGAAQLLGVSPRSKSSFSRDFLGKSLSVLIALSLAEVQGIPGCGEAKVKWSDMLGEPDGTPQMDGDALRLVLHEKTKQSEIRTSWHGWHVEYDTEYFAAATMHVESEHKRYLYSGSKVRIVTLSHFKENKKGELRLPEVRLIGDGHE